MASLLIRSLRRVLSRSICFGVLFMPAWFKGCHPIPRPAFSLVMTVSPEYPQVRNASPNPYSIKSIT